MMKSFALFLLLVNTSEAFMIRTPTAAASSTRQTIHQRFGFMGDQEREKLTRDNEPEEFFATNTDKMSDQEKIPIAIAGVAFIALPFIAGLIALYSAK